jgi:hypothetical protein
MVRTGKQIKALAEFVGLQLVFQQDEDIMDSEISLNKDEDRVIAHFYDYPEEGCIDLDDF